MNSSTEKKSFEGMSISFTELVRIFLSHLWIILIVSIVGALSAFVITYLTVPKTYKATARIFINNSTLSLGESTSISLGDLNASSNLVPTYSTLVKSEWEMLDKVDDETGLNYSIAQLKSMITCSQISDTAFLDISVTSKSAEESMVIVNAIVLKILPNKVDQTIDGSSISIVDLANKDNVKQVPIGYTKKTLYGFIAGFILSAAYVFIRYVFLDDRIDSEEWLKKYFGEQYPLLSVVPDMDVTSKHGYGYYVKRGYYGYYEKTEVNNGNEENK